MLIVDLKIVVLGVVFGVVGMVGQCCMIICCLIIYEDVYDKVCDVIVNVYKQLKIGNLLDQYNYVGLFIDMDVVKVYEKVLVDVVVQGGKIISEGGVLIGEGYESGCYVCFVIVEVENYFVIVQYEIFVFIFYLLKYKGDVENVIVI